MDKNKDLVIEIFSGTLWESEMVISLLQNAEIDAFLKNSVLNSYAYEPVLSEAVKVMISNSDFEKAREIVNDFYRNMKTNTH